ncbi:CENP-S associating centromere protein X-domain-containing protein [Massariosphaeria phaeospora]|uniref:CENP-S associating centromere protein X-domain-containing protein n=1 Tax=Massariosphaeria phaeospora TaxID=100035 RepID=A0A7C8MCA8_9PLEO|nr:CENP-S associating centromere protein X-domain-containing protein [Massariosphaeria phaeospora]
MPPKTINPPKRKGPAFKPPRPVNATKPTATKRASATTAARAAGVTKKATTSRQNAQQATTIISSSESEDQGEAPREDSDRDELMDDASDDEPRDHQPAPAQATQTSPIPSQLLNRLLHENFEDEGTQIQKGAMNLVEKYMDIFVREAIARADVERRAAAKEGGIMDGFLHVEDLEKLAPQLVLDF